ncbi:hypothetical protein HOT31_gp014 [Microbacterium phage Hendrix]|uniref:Uncharacterized protein n=1 Tax=Microbacterium phage Hendrix TaxID=2182341 RepID=A0A2U8UU30_9CAUD|nr:hypothetical protein HOT31_gp014 [Microbacterium phage Hendrix]AWN07685.1 hypothetical protein PBI_HENDRIX_14 [Microbacterium phage Hendrix]
MRSMTLKSTFERYQEMVTRLHIDAGELLSVPDRELLREAEMMVFRYEQLVQFLRGDVRSFDETIDVIDGAKGIIERNQLRKDVAEELRQKTVLRQDQRDAENRLAVKGTTTEQAEPAPDVQIHLSLDGLDEYSARYDAGNLGEVRVSRDLFVKQMRRSGHIVASLRGVR